MLCGCAAEDELVRLSALTDRGQRCGDADRLRAQQLIDQLEGGAPEASALDLNGRWRLLYASEAVYRSSPFFWAFRQATAALSTPVGVPSGNVLAGEPLAAAVYAITDAIPFYDLGSVVQTISGVCSEEEGCLLDEADDPDAADEMEPSDGTDFSLPKQADAQLESRVELIISRLFGLPAASSLMTTRSELPGPVRSPSPTTLETEIAIKTTSAEQSAIASLLPPLGALLQNFPSGDALEMLASGSSRLTLRTTYLSKSLRISRPLIELNGEQDSTSIFVYARESLAEYASGTARTVQVREESS